MLHVQKSQSMSDETNMQHKRPYKSKILNFDTFLRKRLNSKCTFLLIHSYEAINSLSFIMNFKAYSSSVLLVCVCVHCSKHTVLQFFQCVCVFIAQGSRGVPFTFSKKSRFFPAGT